VDESSPESSLGEDESVASGVDVDESSVVEESSSGGVEESPVGVEESSVGVVASCAASAPASSGGPVRSEPVPPQPGATMLAQPIVRAQRIANDLVDHPLLGSF
jgi:hypothetical protein